MKDNNRLKHNKKIKLAELHLENFWPTIPLEVLSLMEIEQDLLFTYISPEKIHYYITEAIRYGQEVAHKYASNCSLSQAINKLLADGIHIKFAQNHLQDRGIRAQYFRKPPKIEIYRSSMEQLQAFFRDIYFEVSEEELIKLHLFHEWFHHLEEKVCGRTDKQLPTVRVKRWGPVSTLKSIIRTREIAAHAFTQTALNLTWPPILIDHLIILTQQNKTKNEIRDYFKNVKERYMQLPTLNEV